MNGKLCEQKQTLQNKENSVKQNPAIKTLQNLVNEQPNSTEFWMRPINSS